MSLFNTPSSITVTCHKHIMPYLAKEVRQLGFDIEEQFITGIRLNGTIKDCIKLNLNLFCASQVLFSLDNFEAHKPEDVYHNLLDIAWEDIIPKGGYFSVTSNVMHPTINNNLYANLIVKDAIVDRLRAVHGERPATGADLDGVVVHLFWKNDSAEIFIDTSGASLGRHGYRKIPGKAPMLEALAAATIFATEWDGKSPFVNPMCGSGTLAIEAALIATKTSPGLFRNNYGFMHLLGYNERDYLKERNILENQIDEQIANLQIIASDISELAISNAKKNAQAAGVEHLITFEVCDFANTTVPPNQNGVVMLNPEYGERLGDIHELETTYSRIGDFFKQKCKGYKGFIFTGNMELAKKIGLKANRRIEFFNSKIECRLLAYELYSGSKTTEASINQHD